MAKVELTIFKPGKGGYETQSISDPVSYVIDADGALVIVRSTAKGNVIIRTTLPYYIEESEGEGVSEINPQNSQAQRILPSVWS